MLEAFVEAICRNSIFTWASSNSGRCLPFNGDGGCNPILPISNWELWRGCFFVISGFIMWTTTTHKKASPAGFFKARLFRVFPLYWIFTCVLLVSIFAVPSAFLNQRSLDVSFLIKSFFLVPTYNPDVGDITPLYTVGWTLVYEMFFYVIFALSLFVPVVRVRLAILIISFCTLVIAGALFNPQGALL